MEIEKSMVKTDYQTALASVIHQSQFRPDQGGGITFLQASFLLSLMFDEITKEQALFDFLDMQDRLKEIKNKPKDWKN
jgi:hypothetical protein